MAEIDKAKLEKALPRLEADKNIWLATVRADGRPHLIPIWYVWLDDIIWIATGRGTQKHFNIQHNPKVAISLEDGVKPVIIEGTAADADTPENREMLAPHFKHKYDWDFRTDSDEDWMLITITPAKLLAW